MEITIIETGEKTKLNIIDPKSGCNWINDLMGNHNELPDYNDEDGTHHMSQVSYDWWADLTKNYQKADDRSNERLNNLEGDKYDNMLTEIQDINCELEDLPANINAICDEYS